MAPKQHSSNLLKMAPNNDTYNSGSLEQNFITNSMQLVRLKEDPATIKLKEVTMTNKPLPLTQSLSLFMVNLWTTS